MGRKKPCLLFFILLTIYAFGEVYSQEGAWSHYSLDGFGSGAHLYDCGDVCCAYTKANSQYILVSDVEHGDWLQADMGSVRSFNALQSQGSVVLAWSDNLLFGYSSLTGDWDTITYEGALLQDGNQERKCSYGCSDSIAFFISDQKFYAFDSRTGSWQDFDYGCPENFSYGIFDAKDDCVVTSILTTDYDGNIKNVVYSSHTASFNSLDNGCFINQSRYDHGFGGRRDKSGTGDEYQIIGYSALDNQFDVIHYVPEDNEGAVIPMETTIGADLFTSYWIGFRTLVTPYERVKAKFFGYSTVLGEWSSVSYDIDLEEENYYGTGFAGARFCGDHSLVEDSGEWIFYFYSADDGTFKKVNTDLMYTSTTSGITVGGSVFGCFDADRAWGYHSVSGLGKYVDLAHEKTSFIHPGDDYLMLTRSSEDNDQMRMYFYNGNSNTWQWKDVKKNTYDGESITPHVYVFDDNIHHDLVVYSAIQDSVMVFDFEENATYYVKENLVYASSNATSFLVDASDCSVHEMNVEFNKFGMGTASAAFFDKAGKTLYGFNAASGQWTTKTIPEEPNINLEEGYIGLVIATHEYDYWGKYYAYNSMKDCWVELIPEGPHVAEVVGKRSAMVVRQDDLYSFFPEDTSAVNAVDEKRVPGSDTFTLMSYPNPFVQYTTIDYQLFKPGRVVLRIFNDAGQEVRTLVNQHQPAGKWSVTWDGTNDRHSPVPPGVYYYQLKVGSRAKNRKVVFLAD